MNRPIRGLHALGTAMEEQVAQRTETTVKELGHLSINSGGVYYVFPYSGLLQLDHKFTYYFDRQGVLRLMPTGDRSGYRVCKHPTKDGWFTLQLARREEAEFGVFPGPRGRSRVVGIDVESSGWHRVTLGDEERPPVQMPTRRKYVAKAAPPAKPEPIQGFRERLRAAQDVLNSAKAELGDDMQMRLDADGQLRVVVMLEI